MILYVAYAGRVAVGYSRNIRTAKDIANEKDADEIYELHVPDVKGEMTMERVRRWRRHSWSKIFIEVP